MPSSVAKILVSLPSEDVEVLRGRVIALLEHAMLRGMQLGASILSASLEVQAASVPDKFRSLVEDLAREFDPPLGPMSGYVDVTGTPEEPRAHLPD